MSLSLAKIVSLLLAYKYFILFPIAILEGPIITVIAGFLASLGQLNIYAAYIAVVLGDIVGDCLLYWLGKSGRRTLVPKFGPYLGLTGQRIEKTEKYFHQNPKKTLILGKVTHAFGSAVLVTAGIVKMDFWEFLWLNILGTLVKSLILILVGYYFGQYYALINSYINGAVYGIVAVTAVLILGYWLASKITKKYFNK